MDVEGKMQKQIINRLTSEEKEHGCSSFICTNAQSKRQYVVSPSSIDQIESHASYPRYHTVSSTDEGRQAV